MASMRVMTVVLLLSLAMAASGAGATGGPKYPAHVYKFVNQILANPDLKILAQAMNVTGLVEPFKHLAAEGVTAFGPTDKAFLSLPKKVLKCLGEEPGMSVILRPILMYHSAGGKYTARKLKSKKSLKSVLGPRMSIRRYKKTLKVDKAVVTKADAISSPTSVAHVIDSVLIPKALLPLIKEVCY
eukprot:TRINITY_DN333_c1_g1_i3.p1 TRINITY_DN333_c1_g1~~TRINITY_DN333_c1_g1_i3.p1  ORF type:complete len:185 (-),score=36.30 TRINITY_DN333_c1_g1_i3:1005-1559(-)